MGMVRILGENGGKYGWKLDEFFLPMNTSLVVWDLFHWCYLLLRRPMAMSKHPCGCWGMLQPYFEVSGVKLVPSSVINVRCTAIGSCDCLQSIGIT